ncbi:hypothetical protein MKW92_028213, partial [Papaver armeniacum]
NLDFQESCGFCFYLCQEHAMIWFAKDTLMYQCDADLNVHPEILEKQNRTIFRCWCFRGCWLAMKE